MPLSGRARRCLLLASAAGAAFSLPLAGRAQGTAAPDAGSTDEPGTIWAPASTENFQAAQRPTAETIDMVVIHDIEGTAEGTVKWFQNPKAHVSAHYVVDGTGAHIWQQVRERDIAWHAGNSSVNHHAVGIEHEGYAYRPGFFNQGQYEASARLVRDITTRYGIPRDRTHIIAHGEVPDPSNPNHFGGRSGHTDPGPFWDWDYYMTLVRSEARLEQVDAPAVVHPGEKARVTVRMSNWGDDPWPLAPRVNAIERRGPIYLAVKTDQPVPAYVNSPFYDAASWVSPRFAASLQGTEEVASGHTGQFVFTVAGPRALGSISEQLRLARVAPAPHLPVAFGPNIALSVRVEPWEIAGPTAEPGFTAPGWESRTEHDRPVLTHRFSGKPEQAGEAAHWTQALPIDGWWEVQARWNGGHGRTRHALYTVRAADGERTVTVDQRKPAEWTPLGRFSFAGAKPQAVVTLRAEGKGQVEAGELRFVGPFPAKAATDAQRGAADFTKN